MIFILQNQLVWLYFNLPCQKIKKLLRNVLSLLFTLSSSSTVNDVIVVSIAWYEEMKITLWVFLVWRQISCHPAQVPENFFGG